MMWAVYRYSLSRFTGKPDMASVAVLAVFMSDCEAFDYAVERQRRFDEFTNNRVRVGVQRHTGSLPAVLRTQDVMPPRPNKATHPWLMPALPRRQVGVRNENEG